MISATDAEYQQARERLLAAMREQCFEREQADWLALADMIDELREDITDEDEFVERWSATLRRIAGRRLTRNRRASIRSRRCRRAR
jgi:hypothetical protein